MGAGTMNDRIPPPPPGFVIEDGQGNASLPPPPPGFVLEGAQEAALAPSNAVTRPSAAGDPNAFDALGYSLSQGVTFGLSDELAAGLHSGFGLLGDYGSALDQERANLDVVKEKYPWLSLGGEIAGGVATGGGLAKGGLSFAANAAKAGKGWYARLLGGSIDGGLMAGAYGAGTGEGGEGRLNSAVNALPYGLVLGAGAEGLATGAGALYRRAFQGTGDVAPGVNAASNVAEAEQFGIPLSRAQATRSVPQANIENQLRSQGAMSSFDQAQREAVGQSVGSVQSRLAGANQNIPGAATPYDAIPGKLRSVRDSLRSASRDAYEASVNNPDVLVSGEAVRALPDFIRNRLTSDQILIDPMYHQGAARAMAFIDDYLGRL